MGPRRLPGQRAERPRLAARHRPYRRVAAGAGARAEGALPRHVLRSAQLQEACGRRRRAGHAVHPALLRARRAARPHPGRGSRRALRTPRDHARADHRADGALREARRAARSRLGNRHCARAGARPRGDPRRDEEARLHPRQRVRAVEREDVPRRTHGGHPARRSPLDARRARRGDADVKRVLVTDTLADSGLAILRAADDVELDYRPGLRGAELLKAIKESDALVTRSGTAVTPELVNAGSRLRVVGRAGVGLDNVDVDACTARGILVINAPTANIMSATEHTMAMMLALCRNIPEAHASVKRGEWVRSKFMGVELSGKTLGIIGLGRIGTRVAARARAFEMRVIAYDPYIPKSVFEKAGAEQVSLDDLLARADVITVHTPMSD